MKSFALYLPLARRRRKLLLSAALLVLADVWLSTQLPYLMSIAVGTAIDAGDAAGVRALLIRMLAFALGSAALGFIGSVLVARAAQRFGDDLRNRLFSTVMEMPYTQSARLETGALITRVMSDTQILSQFLAFLVQSVWRPLIILLLSLWHIGRLGGNLAAWIAAIATLLVVMFLLLRRLTPWFQEIQIHFEKVNSLLKRALSALRAVKAWNRAPWEEARFAGDNDRLLALNLRIQSFMAVVNPLLMLLVNGAVVIVLAVSGGRVRAGAVGISSVMAIVIYVQQMMMCVISLGQLFEMTARTGVSADRIGEIMRDAAPFSSGSAPVPESPLSLRLENASFAYAPGGPDVLHDLTLEPTRWRSTCIVGPTGSGKTTLCLLLARFIDPTAGRAALNGRDLADYDRAALRRRIALVPQTAELAPVSVAENIAYGLPDVPREEIVRAAKLAQADGFIARLPEGYDTPVLQNGASLSGGQRQRILIARALVRRPSILILDDCCTAMDTRTERALRAALREECPDMAVISVSQRLACAAEMDRMLLLVNGRLQAEGTHAELMAQSLVYRELYESQHSEVIA